MKSILYVGATLMIGASIYGFVDYKKTSHRKEFTKMYSAKEDPVTTPVTKNDITVKNQPVISGKKDVSSQPVEEKIIDETKTETPVSVNENNNEKKFKPFKKRKVNYKLFSRAALEERYIDKELKTEEPRKTNNKEN